MNLIHSYIKKVILIYMNLIFVNLLFDPILSKIHIPITCLQIYCLKYIGQVHFDFFQSISSIVIFQ